ncbi:MAG: DUF2313 domain-containing protein [Candidatus Aminicenantes bacterium]|nr:DUF2313 domain-containing protein [Candidatus Aminicenantes bacterium]
MINPNLEEHANALATYMPNGPLFEAKNINDSNFRQLLRGLSGELFTSQGYLVTLNDDYFPDQTTLFLAEWEKALGIPDSCFSGIGSHDDRRRNIVTKLAALGIQTENDFVNLGSTFGVTVTINPGYDVGSIFPMTFPFVFFPTIKEARFTIVVDFTVEAASRFPLVFPFTFGSDEIAILECVFTKLKPANCNIIFRQV